MSIKVKTGSEWVKQSGSPSTSGSVSFSKAQDLSETQKERARNNIGAVSADDVSAAVSDAVFTDEDGIIKLDVTLDNGRTAVAEIKIGSYGLPCEIIVGSKKATFTWNGFESTVYSLTDGDKTDIANTVISLLPVWEGGVY